MEHVPPTLRRHLEMQRYRRAHKLYVRQVARQRKVARKPVPLAVAPPKPGVEQEKRRRIRDLFRRNRKP